MYEGSHTPLITKDLYYRVQAMFEKIDRTKKHDIQFAYTGLIKCKDCGCYLTAEFKRGRHKKGHYIVYSRLETILKFSERLPELFLKGTAEEKKQIVTTMTKSIEFDGENLIVKLKDTFKALQNVKEAVKRAKKPSTLEPLQRQ